MFSAMLFTALSQKNYEWWTRTGSTWTKSQWGAQNSCEDVPNGEEIGLNSYKNVYPEHNVIILPAVIPGNLQRRPESYGSGKLLTSNNGQLFDFDVHIIIGVGHDKTTSATSAFCPLFEKHLSLKPLGTHGSLDCRIILATWMYWMKNWTRKLEECGLRT